VSGGSVREYLHRLAMRQDVADESLPLAERLNSLRPGLPCCLSDTGECTGGSHCWADEPDNIPEGWGEQ
jgi:hypothetical protein